MDSITAAVYNVVFTSMPILLFSILDRPVKNLNAYIRYPQVRRTIPAVDVSSHCRSCPG